MSRYITRRFLWLLVILIAISLITFILMHLVPGGPWDQDKKLPPEIVANLNERYGLDEPLWQQYGSFLWSALQGNLGASYLYQDRDVTGIILDGLPATLSLGLAAFLISILIGLPLGILGAIRQNSHLDRASVLFATMLASIPNFVLGILLMLLFSIKFHLLPSFGWGTISHLIMPAIALGALPAAYNARIIRASILEILGQEYILTAQAKGLKPRTILFKHVLRNALIPILTVMGPELAALICGSFIIENLFSIPGIGRAFVEGVFARDYGLIMGTTLFYATVIAVLNLVVDLLYAVVDPRIRLS